ncbi:MAG: PepSY domain-containing protein [Ignavibacteria bacterium]
MNAEKIFLPVLFLLLSGNNVMSKGISNKYNHSTANFLDTNINKSISITDAVDYAKRLMEGEIVKAERRFKKDIPFWKLDLVTGQKGIVEFEIALDEKNIIRIESGEGPFEYELVPAEKFVSFSKAKKAAEDFTGQKILKWNYFKNKSAWEYNFWIFTKSGKAQVRVDAESGEVIKNKKKR